MKTENIFAAAAGLAVGYFAYSNKAEIGKSKHTTTMKTVLVFVDGELYRQITYKTKSDTIKNYNHFLRNGMIDSFTGSRIKNATFEIL